MEQSHILALIGRAIFGPVWQQALSKRLLVNERTLRHWLSGDQLPPGIVAELAAIAMNQADDFERRTRVLRKMANELGGPRPLPAPVTVPDSLLTDFRVIPTGSWDDPEIRFLHDGDLVLAMVTREAWEDLLNVTFHLTSNQGRYLSERYLERLAPIISKKYLAGEFDMLYRAGGNYPRVLIKEADLRSAGIEKERALDLLESYAQANFGGFQTQVYSALRQRGEWRKR